MDCRRGCSVTAPPSAVPGRAAELDYHVARVLLLVAALGETADGLTKIAKLDFLLRYPNMLGRVLADRGLALPRNAAPSPAETVAVESTMVRYKYGPWDDRYYPILGTLIGTGLVRTRAGRGRIAISLTEQGRSVADALARTPEWSTVAARGDLIAAELGAETGSRLKELIYRVLPDAVDRPLRQRIGPGPTPPDTPAASAAPAMPLHWGPSA